MRIGNKIVFEPRTRLKNCYERTLNGNHMRVCVSLRQHPEEDSHVQNILLFEKGAIAGEFLNSTLAC